MNILSSKLLWLAPISVIIVLVILSIAFYPAYNPKPKDINIAIINKDEGGKVKNSNINIGNEITKSIQKNKQISDKVNWKIKDNPKDFKKLFSNENFAGAIIIDQNLTKNNINNMASAAKASTLKTQESEQFKESSLKFVTNKGISSQTSNFTELVFSEVGKNIKENITKQNILSLNTQKIEKVNINNLNIVTNPINIKNDEIYKISDHQGGGNAPFLMFMPIWLSSLLAAVCMFFSFTTSEIKNLYLASTLKVIITLLSSILGSAVYVLFMKYVLGFSFSNVTDIITYLSIALFGFTLFILGIMIWLELKSLPIFILMLFFSMQLVILPKEMLPNFYQKYIVSWNPFVNYADNLRDILYFHKSLVVNDSILMFIIFAIFGILSLFLANQFKFKNR